MFGKMCSGQTDYSNMPASVPIFLFAATKIATKALARASVLTACASQAHKLCLLHVCQRHLCFLLLHCIADGSSALGCGSQWSLLYRLQQMRHSSSRRKSKQQVAQCLVSFILLLLLLPPGKCPTRQARRRKDTVGALRWTSLSESGSPLQGGVV